METNHFPHTKTPFCLSVPTLFVQLALSIFYHNSFPISPRLKIFPTIPSANAIPNDLLFQTPDSRPHPRPQLPGVSSMTTRICGVKSWTAIFSTTTVWTPRKIGAPKKGTSRFSSAPLRRRLHEFYFGGSQFVVLRAAN